MPHSSNTSPIEMFADDVVALGEWARQRWPDLPVHLLGTSFGAFHALHAIATGRTRFASALPDAADWAARTGKLVHLVR